MRRWWLVSRNPVPLEAFRILAGATLCAHFVKVLLQSELIPERMGATAAALASAGIAAGFWPRMCATGVLALSLLALFTHPRGAAFEQGVVTAYAFFIAVLPIGTAWTSWSRGGARRHVAGVSTSAFLVWVSLAYLVAARHVHPAYLACALQGIPILYLLPGTEFQVAGVGLQLVTHAWLIRFDSPFLANLMLCETAILLFGEEPLERTDLAVDAPSMAAAAFVVITTLTILLGEVPRYGEHGQRLLARVGGPPSEWTLIPPRHP